MTSSPTNARAASSSPPFIGEWAKSLVPAPFRRAAHRFDRGAGVLGRIADMEVRLARSTEEVRAAQALRYRVFFTEMSARPSAVQRLLRRDRDGFDLYCDHLLVVDNARGGEIVGTYRLLAPEGAALAGRFYSAGEFRVDALVARHPNLRFMELGRSCVVKEYRSKRTVELLWQGIWRYVNRNRVDVLFGCASLEGTDAEALRPQLAVLGAVAPAPAEWSVSALPHRAVPLATGAPPVDPRKTLGSLPPLLKGYLRLGGVVGPDAVVDDRFNTTDVLVVLPVADSAARYRDYYGGEAVGRHAPA